MPDSLGGGYDMWKEPKTDWMNADLPTLSDFDRIEQNIQFLNELLG